MNYDEIEEGTKFKRKDGAGPETVLYYSDHHGLKVHVCIEKDGKFMGGQTFYKNYFEEKYEEVEDEQD